MRSLFVGSVLGPLVFCLLSCASPDPTASRASRSAAADPAPLLSAFEVADPAAERQLVEGFFAVEQGAWRWTAQRFSLLLKNPAIDRETELEFRFTVAPESIERLGALTLSAFANGVGLPSMACDSADDLVYSAVVPPGADEAVRVNFHLDKALPPSGTDERSLGVIAVSAALRSIR